ncbi:polymerase [Acidithiobacillus sp. CV18-2]|nr:polymerase [Acidithiobacillus sp. CV18-3]MBU2757845.1 polymerase [Acidithiobacillus sp. BN09-2]MBU2777890.1 polymerase [Acidithiobacillus sp. CV18-2]MBU2799338.1 polymerase [Acidithiobacillus sp. VAN18-4]
MRLRISDPWMFSLYALPLFLFPLSTAGSGIAMGLLIIAYAISGHRRNWRQIGARRWYLPWLLLMAWSAIGLLWTSNMFFGQKVTVSTFDAIFAFIGATLPWQERWVKWVIRWFLAGILVNEILAFLMTWKILPWHNTDAIPYTGFCDHIFLSLIIAHAVLWLIYDQKIQWNFSRWINWVLIFLFALQMALTPGRSGQVLLILLLPIALFLLYPGRWRWALPLAGALGALLLLVIPEVRQHLLVGVQELVTFSPTQADVQTSWGIRLVAIWAGALLFWLHPIFGVGTGDFYPAVLHLQAQHLLPATPGFIMNTAANSFLSEAASLGLIGLILFLWVLWAIGKESWQARQTPQGWFVLAYFAIYVIGGLFDSLSWGYADAVNIALFAGMPLLARWSPDPRR